MQKEKSKYNSLTEWNKADPRAYEKAKKLNMLDDICEVFGWKKNTIKKQGYWTLERALEECKKHINFRELKKNNKSTIECARSNGFLDEIYKFYNIERKSQKRRPAGYWTKEKCLEDALKYKTKIEWEKAKGSSYAVSKYKGWYDECTAHMINKIKSRGYWTLEKCKEDALKYNTKEEWKKSPSAYGSAIKNGWTKECTAHMTQTKKLPGYWTKEKCIEEAKKYSSKGEWNKKHQVSYNASRHAGCFDECVSHMKLKEIKPKGYWTKEKCKEDALKYKQLKDWLINNRGAVASARKNRWIDECCGHMIKYTHAKK